MRTVPRGITCTIQCYMARPAGSSAKIFLDGARFLRGARRKERPRNGVAAPGCHGMFLRRTGESVRVWIMIDPDPVPKQSFNKNWLVVGLLMIPLFAFAIMAILSMLGFA